MKCLCAQNDIVLVGCADGGLRLLQIDDNGCFDPKPRVWERVNGKTGPGISSVCMDKRSSANVNTNTNRKSILCASGGDDGSIALWELKQLN